MKRLHTFFENKVDEEGDRIAINCHDNFLSYNEIDYQANQWSHFLKAQGIGQGQLVGIFLDRSFNLYILILAVLKVGAAYVPIDPNYPEERINFILSDSKACALISTTELTQKITLTIPRVFHINQLQHDISTYPAERLPIPPTSELSDICYVIYTSGTTGKPKGVAVSHGSVIHYVNAALSIYDVHAEDRVYQGFSIAFDASIEEIWLAFGSGATLIVGTSDALHAGAGLVDFLTFHEVTVFSTVPTMLAMLEGQVPSLRLLILGGEICPPELIARWHRPELRIINTYGPTETTVIATYKICEPGKPITLGQPLPNYEIAILDEKLRPVKPGETGELCIGGPGLANGYIGRPDLTTQKFISHPSKDNVRLYRTGDLVHLTPEGEIQFVGRGDEQIKLRGFRIELSEIESVLLTYPNIKNAAVQVHELADDVKILIAYLVLKDEHAFNEETLRTALSQKLPHYMIPAFFEIMPNLPQLPSGKVDRKSLPIPKRHQEKISADHVAARTETEKKLVCVWENFFKRSPISIKANFFHDLGGHSLASAKIVSELRKFPGMEYLSMLDIYEHPTIEALAKKIEISLKQAQKQEDKKAQLEDEPKEKKIKRHRFCGIAQIFGCYLYYGVAAWEFLLLYLLLTYIENHYGAFSLYMVGALLLLMITLPLLSFAVVIAAKWIILGKVKPGTYRLWGAYYFRWWLVERLQKLAPVDFLIGSPLINFYYRLMGAKIGKNCHILTSKISGFDLINIDDDSSIGYKTTLSAKSIENGWINFHPINIGKHCIIGSQSIIENNTTMADHSKLDDLSILTYEKTIPTGKCLSGSPGKLKDYTPSRHAKKIETTTLLSTIQYSLLHYLGLLLITFLYYATFLPGIILVDYFYELNQFTVAFLLAAPLAGLIYILLYAGCVLLMKKLLLGRVKAGAYQVRSLFYLRYWIIERLIGTRILTVLSDSLYYPPFLRLLGAKIGKHVEVGELYYAIPDLLTIEDDSFVASGIFIGAMKIEHGFALLAPLTIGKRTFIGNDAQLPQGTTIGDHCLIGCLSTVPKNKEAEKPNTSWLGSPPFHLPHREVQQGFSDEKLFNPPWWLYLSRLSIEFIRITLPSILSFFSLLALFFSVDYLNSHFSLLMVILLFPLFDFLIMLGLSILVIALKWILMGKMKETVKPVWSLYIWKYDLIVYLFEGILVPIIIEPLLGTPFLPYLLKLLGLKIGKRTLLNTIYFAELDLIEIGDEVILSSDSLLLTHLYEDRVLKMSKIKVEDGCHVGTNAFVLYDTLMKKNSSLGSLSLLMKGETLPENSHWEGLPSQHVN